jgi:hypothetical protein
MPQELMGGHPLTHCIPQSAIAVRCESEYEARLYIAKLKLCTAPALPAHCVLANWIPSREYLCRSGGIG